DEDVLVQPLEGFHHGVGGDLAFREDDAGPLRALQQLDHDWGAADAVDAAFQVVGLARIHSRRHADVVPAQDLQAPQLVARAGDRLRLVDAVDAHHFELSNHGEAEERDRRAYAGNDGVDRADRLALVEQLGAAFADVNVELQRVEHADLVATRPGRLHEDASAVERRLPRQNHQTHTHLPARFQLTTKAQRTQRFTKQRLS